VFPLHRYVRQAWHAETVKVRKPPLSDVQLQGSSEDTLIPIQAAGVGLDSHPGSMGQGQVQQVPDSNLEVNPLQQVVGTSQPHLRMEFNPPQHGVEVLPVSYPHSFTSQPAPAPVGPHTPRDQIIPQTGEEPSTE
jgi:hypothetical protein